jgi:drug/metabolite transporter (DMT)-like permease
MSTLFATLAPLGVLFGLLSAVAWGTGDFCGGLATKRSPGLRVVMVTEFVGAGILIALAVLTGEAVPMGISLGVALAAGLAGALGLGSLYQGLAMGQMGVVAPLSAVVGGIVPIIVGVVTEGPPSPIQALGFGVALLAVWLLAATGEFRPSRRELTLALLAGVGFGLYFVLIAYASGGGLFWNLSAARLVAGFVLIGLLLVMRQPLWPERPALGLTTASGVADAGGNLFYALAAQISRLDIAAVLASLYPGMTVLLARVVLHEKLTRAQLLGVLAALVAVALIAR